MAVEEASVESPLGEYTRRKFKLSLGDGPDNRGEVTVEMVRADEPESRSFADWYQEVDRAVDTLREHLATDDEADAE